MIVKSSFKEGFIENSLYNLIRFSKKSVITTMSRSTTIFPSFIGKKFHVHNGRFFLPVIISEQMLYKKLGEFSFTRAKYIYKKKKKKGSK
jgi:small subunit ribosomal protein S19